jgi:peptide/nickel transport system ATP-binding protein
MNAPSSPPPSGDASPAAPGGLRINGLRLEVEFAGHDIVDEVDLVIPPGRILGLVGESGSGKTTVGLAVLGHTRRGVRIAGGVITCGPTEIFALDPEQLRAVRGGSVAYVPQDPSSSLNPALRIRTQLLEVLEVHDFGGSAEARNARLVEMMDDVLLPSTDEFFARYPHQLSGGQQQRVALAMSFACRPSVIVLDEPTTGLDVSTQAHVLQTVRSLASLHQVAALYITHDLAVVADLADDVAVMYAGRVVEHGPTRQIFAHPVHPYTRHLVAAAPDIGGAQAIRGLGGRAPAPGKRPTGCAFALRCELVEEACRSAFPPVVTVGENHRVRCIRAGESVHTTEPSVKTASSRRDGPPVLRLRNVDAGYQSRTVVHRVTFDLHQGECVALVGESGSGKTTLSRAIGGLHREWTGTISLDDSPLAHDARRRTGRQRMKMQYVFQNPYSSLNPRRSIGESVLRPLLLMGLNRSDGEREVARMLERVSLTAAYANQYPNQLSGGERQRVAIARALVCNPDVLICDEITSALDVLVQAAIVQLLGELRAELGLSMLFVTHNLPLVRSIADSVAVMQHGHIVEFGPTESVIGNPQEEYTRALIADTPSIEATRT